MAERRVMEQEDPAINWEDIRYEVDPEADQDVIDLNELAVAPAKLYDVNSQNGTSTIEKNLGLGNDHKPTYVNAALEAGDMTLIIKLLKQYRDCFAWDYSEMPGLDRSLVEHKIPLKTGYKPHKQQPPRRFSEAIVAKIKEEVLRLLAVEFIEVAVYVEWLSNVVPVIKKNGKTRVCTDFRNLNLASPKDDVCLSRRY